MLREAAEKKAAEDAKAAREAAEEFEATRLAYEKGVDR